MVRVASLYSLEPFDFDSSHILNFAHPQFCGSHFTQPRLAWFAFKRLPLEVLRPQSQPKPTSGECTLPFPGTKAQKPIVGSPSMCARNRSISGQNEMARRKTRHSHGKHLSRQRPGQTYWSMSPLRRQRLALRQESAIWKHAWGHARGKKGGGVW